MLTKEPYLAVNDGFPLGVEGRYTVVVDGHEITVEVLESLMPAMDFYKKHRRKIRKFLAEKQHN